LFEASFLSFPLAQLVSAEKSGDFFPQFERQSDRPSMFV
jgi:hypothetical protein